MRTETELSMRVVLLDALTMMGRRYGVSGPRIWTKNTTDHGEPALMGREQYSCTGMRAVGWYL